MQTKVTLVKPGDKLMNSNPGKVNQLKCLKSKKETKFSPNLVISLKHLTIILQTHSYFTYPLAYVYPVEGVFYFQRINVQKVIKLLKAIDVSKATGLDKIPNRLLKIAADVVAPSLTGIFNQSLVTGIFPSDWKLAKVSPIFKNGSKSDLNNYRPISVIPTVGKIFDIWMKMVLFNSGQSCTALLLPCWRQTIAGVSILIEVFLMA